MEKQSSIKWPAILGAFALTVAAGAGRASATAPARTAGTEESVALEQIIVTAGRVEEDPETVGSSYTIITREEIERSQALYLHDILRGVPGLSVSSDGAFGGRTSIFMRGADSGKTAVMIDGIRIYDPIATNAALDPANLPAAGIERVEIIRGPQSTLYGSDAMGGVINIITRRGEGPPRLTASFSAGSHRTWQPSLNISGGEGPFTYDLTASFLDSAGISVVEGGERDFYRRHGLSGGFSWQAADTLSIGLNLHSWHARFGLDDPPLDDPDYEGDNRFQLLQLQVEHLAGAKWEHRLNLGLQKNLRHTANDPDALNQTFERSRYEGEIQSIDWQHNLFLQDWYTLLAGVARQREEGASRISLAGDGPWGPWTFESAVPAHSATTDSFFLLNRFAGNGFTATIGGRADRHSRFGSHLTWRATAAGRLPGAIRAHGSYGTGFKAPSIFQLHDPANGNIDLEAEKSAGWDIGLARRLEAGAAVVSLQATYFQNRFRNLIDWVMVDPLTWDGQYFNVGRAASSGFEYGAGLEAGPFFGRIDYTRTNASEKPSGAPLLRRPRHAWHLEAGRHFGERATVSLSARRREKSHDLGGVRLDDYTICDLQLTYRLNPDTTIQAKVVNLFDEDYQEVDGYATENRAFYAGITRAW